MTGGDTYHYTTGLMIWTRNSFFNLKGIMDRSKEVTSCSPAGNRTPVSRVTGGDTYHYTTEDFTDADEKYFFHFKGNYGPFKRSNFLLPGGESNPGLLRDRRGYLPLYYRGLQ